MASIRLRIVTPEVCIPPRHIDYLTAVGDGETRVVVNGKVLKAHCRGGMLHVAGGEVNLLTTQFEWKNA